MKSADKDEGLERRRSHRLYTNSPIEYCALFQGQKRRLASRATMKNISQGGAYLEFETKPRLLPGQFGEFTFKSLAAEPEKLGCKSGCKPGSIHLTAQGIIRRLDRLEGVLSFGVAVEFLSRPLISCS